MIVPVPLFEARCGKRLCRYLCLKQDVVSDLCRYLCLRHDVVSDCVSTSV